ncbi:hypothetical protein NP233_g142 [Leucocoprinus birnbaumii]|uniref:peptidylprolyl isomerase n=1 Tax=Leucocoprinus birnbaumii TaxID=56174 RepID=A0AAD5W2H1_9AGAR|nr:hypothetical protein NP233_g142 [Leucocoprinus birnbaumii]
MSDSVVLETSLGDVQLELYWDHAPKTCKNFAELAKKGYYNGVIFHRIIADFMIQGGDPTGTGRGGTSIYGQKFEDEIHPELRFTGAGILAMANSGPNTNGSQFFITLAPTPYLDNKHTIFGRVSSGMRVVQRLGAVATDAQDKPREDVKIHKARAQSRDTRGLIGFEADRSALYILPSQERERCLLITIEVGGAKGPAKLQVATSATSALQPPWKRAKKSSSASRSFSSFHTCRYQQSATLRPSDTSAGEFHVSSTSLEDGRSKASIDEVIAAIQTQTSDVSSILSVEASNDTFRTETGHFAGAHDFTIMQPSFLDNSQSYQFLVTEQPVVTLLKNASVAEAGLDAAARYPPPRCHPGTRKGVQEQLCRWLLDQPSIRKLTWLFGPAGGGKSAIVQTFAEHVKGRGLLAAAYFCSNSEGSKRSDPLRIIPTLAFQLANHYSVYKHSVTRKLASDPSILDATLEVQFRGLIEEPFLQITSQSFKGGPGLIVIDGLDECSDDEVQCELLGLIKRAVLNSQLPLIWLISSRPERHIKSIILHPQFARLCQRVEILVDKELRVDAEIFLRARFREIHNKFQDVMSVSVDQVWPQDADFKIILEAVDGHFAVASTAERFVGDHFASNPEAQLTSLIGLLQVPSSISTINPLKTLDTFYHRILVKVSERCIRVAMNILALHAYDRNCIGFARLDRLSTRKLWLFLHIDQASFYSSMQKLHSVVDIPPSQEASERGLAFYHKSFPDYLTNSSRSGKFFIPEEVARQCQLACTFHWYNMILQYKNVLRVTTREYREAESSLKEWFCGALTQELLEDFREQLLCSYKFGSVPKEITCENGFLDQLHIFNFNLMPDEGTNSNLLLRFAIALAQTIDKTDNLPFIRTEVNDDATDQKLLYHLSLLSNGEPVDPLDLTALDPLEKMEEETIAFVIVGVGSKSGLACIGHWLDGLEWRTMWLDAVLPPTVEQKRQYQRWENEIVARRQGWGYSSSEKDSDGSIDADGEPSPYYSLEISAFVAYLSLKRKFSLMYPAYDARRLQNASPKSTEDTSPLSNFEYDPRIISNNQPVLNGSLNTTTFGIPRGIHAVQQLSSASETRPSLHSPTNHYLHGPFDSRFQMQSKSLVGEVISSVQPRNGGIDSKELPGPNLDGQGGPFAGAHDFTMTHPAFYDMSQNYSYIMTGQPVLMLLRNTGTPEAGLDAAARFPAPRCHPGTRKTIQENLFRWLFESPSDKRMVWLFGPAGVGKSAVAQTFAEAAKRNGLLASAYFLSSTQGVKRSDSLRIIPTLAYQLAIHNDHYKHIITQTITSDPSILDATLESQFRGLVIEPFLQLSSYGIQPFGGKLHVIIIDGLDECSDDDAQCELVELIKDAAQRAHIPLIWLICSRPERHLKSTFSQLEYADICGREELLIDRETRGDVEQFLHSRFKDIRKRFHYMINVDAGSPWPTEEEFQVICGVVDGHFVVAAVVERFIGDRVARNPQGQLASLVSMLRGLSNVGVANPLEALDNFYSRILAKTPDQAWPLAQRVLAISAYNLDRVDRDDERTIFDCTRQIWLFLGSDQAQFYSVMEALHSVLDIPSPEDACSKRLTFYHKSFPDYLVNKSRSGRYFISREHAYQCHLACAFNWLNAIYRICNPNHVSAEECCHADSMINAWPHKPEFEPTPRLGLYTRFAVDLAHNYLIRYKMPVKDSISDVLIHALLDFNFNLLSFHKEEFSDNSILPMFAVDAAQDPRANQDFVRTVARDEIVDSKLLQHLSILTNGRAIKQLDLSTTDPFENIENKSARYVIVGVGSKSGLACIGKGLTGYGCSYRAWRWSVIWLNAALPPTRGQKYRYREWEQEIIAYEKSRGERTIS